MRRRNLLILLISHVLVASVATLVAVTQIRSPAEEAARTAPPEPSPILVPVEQRVLTSRVVSRGTARYGSSREITVVPSRLKRGTDVITALPDSGQVVSAGDVLLEISGRPVFVFQGRQPSYRDLGPGVSGPDVRQLENGLRAAGLDPGVVDGVYDHDTEDAVTAIYRRHGFQPVVATQEQIAAAQPLEAQLVAGASADAGVQVPADEAVFVPSTPVRVDELPTEVGATARGTLVTVTGSEVVIDGLLTLDQAGLVQPGAKVTIDEPALGLSATGTVASVADRPGSDGADAFHVAFEVAVNEPPSTIVGTSLRLTMPLQSTQEAQLTVPVSAVSVGADGVPRVQRSQGDGFAYVPVKTGLSADGYVVVTPTSGDLSAGDDVVVGFDNLSTGG